MTHTQFAVFFFSLGVIVLLTEFIWRRIRQEFTLYMLFLWLEAIPLFAASVFFTDFIKAATILKIIISIPLGIIIWHLVYRLIALLWFAFGGR